MESAGQVFVPLRGSSRDATGWMPVLRHPLAGAPSACTVLPSQENDGHRWGRSTGQIFDLLHGSSRDATGWMPVLRHPLAGAPDAALVVD